MKGLVLSTLGGLMIVSMGSGYADAIRVTVINESSHNINLLFKSTRETRTAISGGAAKMFTVDYKYPDSILMKSLGKNPKPCNWSMPVVGPQTIGAITMNISTDESTNAQTCLLSWQ